MGRLFHFDFRRLFHKPAFYICAALCLIFSVLAVNSIYSNLDFYRQNGYNEQLTIMLGKITLNSIVSVCIANSVLPLLMAVFTCGYFCDDYEQGTVKTILARGYDKRKMFFSKSIICTACLLLFYFIVLMTAVIGAKIIESSFGTSITLALADSYHISLASQLLIILLQYLALNSFYFMTSEIARKSTPAFMLGLVGPSLLMVIIQLIANIINETFELSWNLRMIYQYFLPTPLSLLSGSELTSDTNITTMIIANVCYIILFAGLGLLLSVKRRNKDS